MAIIEVAGVTKEYPRGITSLKDVSVTIEAGEFVYVLGASGSGKSSFIKLLSGYQTHKRNGDSLVGTMSAN